MRLHRKAMTEWLKAMMLFGICVALTMSVLGGNEALQSKQQKEAEIEERTTHIMKEVEQEEERTRVALEIVQVEESEGVMTLKLEDGNQVTIFEDDWVQQETGTVYESVDGYRVVMTEETTEVWLEESGKEEVTQVKSIHNRERSEIYGN